LDTLSILREEWGSRTGFIDIWDITNGRRTGRLNTADMPLRLGVSSDGSTLLANGRDGLRYWHAPSFAEIEAAERERASLQPTTTAE